MSDQLLQILPFAVILAIFYLAILRPMQNKKKTGGTIASSVHGSTSSFGQSIGGAVGGAGAGLVVGYFLFARINGEYITPELYLRILFSEPRGLVMRVGFFVGAFETIRQNSLIATAIGAVLGLSAGLVETSRPKHGSFDPGKPESEEKRIACPHCAELILPAATVCRFCNREVKASLVQDRTP